MVKDRLFFPLLHMPRGETNIRLFFFFCDWPFDGFLGCNIHDLYWNSTKHGHLSRKNALSTGHVFVVLQVPCFRYIIGKKNHIV